MRNGKSSVADRAELARELQAQGLTLAEIGAELGVSANTIHRNLSAERRARESALRRDVTASRRAIRETIRGQVDGQLAVDRGRGAAQGVLLARFDAVHAATRALAAGEPHALEGLVGATVDVAAAAILVAEELLIERAAQRVEPVSERAHEEEPELEPAVP